MEAKTLQNIVRTKNTPPPKGQGNDLREGDKAKYKSPSIYSGNTYLLKYKTRNAYP